MLYLLTKKIKLLEIVFVLIVKYIQCFINVYLQRFQDIHLAQQTLAMKVLNQKTKKKNRTKKSLRLQL